MKYGLGDRVEYKMCGEWTRGTVETLKGDWMHIRLDSPDEQPGAVVFVRQDSELVRPEI